MNKTTHWQSIIDDYKVSGLTQKIFCQNNNIKIHTFHYWLKKLNESSESSNHFIQFETTQPKQPISIQIGHAQITVNMADIAPLLIELDQSGLLYDPS